MKAGSVKCICNKASKAEAFKITPQMFLKARFFQFLLRKWNGFVECHPAFFTSMWFQSKLNDFAG